MSEDDLLTYDEASRQYGYNRGTLRTYVNMGYLIGMDNKIPRYEMERYILQRRKQGQVPKFDKEKLRQRIIEIATEFAGSRPGWHYNKGAYVLVAARILGHSPIWISRILKVPLDEVKEVCKRLHLSGTWKGAKSSHTEWSNLDAARIDTMDAKALTAFHIGFALDALVGEGQLIRYNVSERFCMVCGGPNPIKAWICPACGEKHLMQVPLLFDGPTASYEANGTQLQVGSWNDTPWRYPLEATSSTFGLSSWKGDRTKWRPPQKSHFSESECRILEDDLYCLKGLEDATPTADQSWSFLPPDRQQTNEAA